MVAQCELQPSGNEKSGDEPPLGGLWKGTDETGQQGGHTRPCGANQSAPEHEAARAAHPDELKPGLQIRRLWRQRNVIRRPAEKLAPRNFWSGGALWGSSRRSIRRRLAGRLALRTFPSGGALWSLPTDAGREMRRPIIKAAVEEACSKSGGHGERGKRDGGDREDQGSCGVELCIFSKALVYFQSACIFSKRLYLSKRLYYFSKRLYSKFLSVSQHLFIFLIVSQRYYY